MHKLDTNNKCKKIFAKLSKKNPKQMWIIRNKIFEILQNPEHYKPLKGDMKGLRRVHIDDHFVLTYEIEGDIVRVLDYDHHDYIYK